VNQEGSVMFNWNQKCSRIWYYAYHISWNFWWTTL